jgi:NAD/NADP transhydrogenase beta subunit
VPVLQYKQSSGILCKKKFLHVVYATFVKALLLMHDTEFIHGDAVTRVTVTSFSTYTGPKSM